MLWLKMLRDLKENKGAYIACTGIIVLGLLTFTAFSTMVKSLEESQLNFYASQNFADGFAQVESMPKTEIKKLQALEGIKKLQGRIVKDVLLHRPEAKENAYLRLVSMDPQDENPINGVLLDRGMPLESGAMKVWLDDKFFAANHLELNDGIEIIADGKVRSLSVVGVGKSPEFVYALRTAADLYPSPETFGIAFISTETVEKLFSQAGAVNDLVFTLMPGADYRDVERKVEHLLEPYGLKSIFPRDDQPSHLFLQQEIDGIKSMSKALPMMFLTIAAMILYITLKRVIEQQRGQIGIFKAQGFTSREVMFHYLSYALTIGVVGGLVGGILGTVLAYPLASMFEYFFSLPALKGNFSISYILFSLLLSLAFSLLAGYYGCKRVLDLEPAEAMRPPAPIEGKKVFFENMAFLWRRLKVQNMMALRNLTRNKGRSGLIFFGIVLCFAISAFTWSMNDLVQKMMFDQYEKVEVYDIKVSLARPVDQKEAYRELRAIEGVTEVEPMAEVPVTLTNQWRKKDTVLLGLPREGYLYNILDDDYNKILPPIEGLLLSERLAKLLDAQVGTRLKVESPMKASDGAGYLEVAGIIPQYVGINAYMEIEALQGFLRQKGLATSFLINLDQEGVDVLREKYIGSKVVSTIDERSQRLDKFKEMMATYGSMIYIYSLIGGVIGFAIIYSSSVIALSERSRELASMMVLGMTPKEVLSVVTFEQWCIALPAMAMGVPVSKLMMAGMAESFSNDIYTMPQTLTSSSMVLAFVATGLSVWIAQKAVVRKIRNLSLVEVLKSAE